MRGLRGLAMIGALMCAAPAAAYAAMQPVQRDNFTPVGDPYLGGNRRRGKGSGTKRGNGKIAKRAKRTNRLTISKRVRRKHRRAA